MEEQKNDDVPRVKSVDDIAAIAKRLDISFLHISNREELFQFLHEGNEQMQASKDPFVDPFVDVLVVATGAVLKLISPKNYHNFDYLLRYKGRKIMLPWRNNATYACFIKSILNRDDHVDTCCICYEFPSHDMKKICGECGAQLCAKCAFKIYVAGENDNEFPCPLCRKVSGYNPFVWYLLLQDQLDQLNEEEQTLLARVQAADLWRNERQQMWLERKKYKEGARVRVYGLEQRKDLNNRIGIIAEDHAQKCGVGRWPVLMEGENQSKELMVFIEESNLNVICSIAGIHADLLLKYGYDPSGRKH